MRARSPHVAAALLMLLAVFLFALMDACLKLLSARYPPMQVAALRGLSSLPPVLIWALCTVPLRSLLRVRWPLHLLRGVLGVAMMAGFIYGIRDMPLSTAYAIFFVAPLLVTMMAGPLLGERVDRARWIAIGVGLFGVLVVLRPTGEGMASLGGLAVLVAAICYAAGAITVRMLARYDSTQAMVVWFMVLLSFGALALAWSGWRPMRIEDAWLIVAIGICGSLAQIALTEAFRRGEASMIAPLEYTALIWGVTLDIALWGVVPETITWIGAAIIIGSGWYLLRREASHAEAEHP